MGYWEMGRWELAADQKSDCAFIYMSRNVHTQMNLDVPICDEEAKKREHILLQEARSVIPQYIS